MNRLRLFAIGTVVLFALTLVAQQAATQNAGRGENPHSQGGVNSGVPTVEDHLKMLSEKLALTTDQQTKARPILQEMHDGARKVMQDQKISDDERTSKLRACHLRADKKMREILNDDQKKRLDQLEEDAHIDLHGNGNGGTAQAK